MATLKVIVDYNNSQHRILSPAVGYYSKLPQNGTFLNGGAFIGKLKILNSSFDLYLPEDVFGKVKVDEERDKKYYVEYKQELFRLEPVDSLAVSERQTEVSESMGEDKLEDGYLITTFTTGIFYSRPSPDAPPYVEEGQKIEKGKVLGLIEVMKTFNHVVFQGTDTSESGVIKKILVEDAQEVKLGEGLFVVKEIN